MSVPIKINNNIVSGPEEAYIPAHLSYGQYLFDQLRKGGNDIALVSISVIESNCVFQAFANSQITILLK